MPPSSKRWRRAPRRAGRARGRSQRDRRRVRGCRSARSFMSAATAFLSERSSLTSVAGLCCSRACRLRLRGQRLHRLVASLEVTAEARDLAVLLRHRRRGRRDGGGQRVDALHEHVETRREARFLLRVALRGRQHDSSRVPSTRAPRGTASRRASPRLSEPRAERSLTRLSEPTCLETLLPVEHERALLERLRAAEPAGLRDSAESFLRVDSVTDEPAADDDARAPAAGPAVHVDDSAAGELGVDLVERRDQLFASGNREVADGSIDVSSEAPGRATRMARARRLASGRGRASRRRRRGPAPRSTRSRAPSAQGWRPAMRRPGSMTVGGRTTAKSADGPLPRPRGASHTAASRCR